MSYQAPNELRAPSSYHLGPSTARSATAKSSPFFKSETPNGTQDAPITIDDDEDEEELPSFKNVVASARKRKRDDSTFIISDDEDKKTPKGKKAAISTRKPTQNKSPAKTRTPKASPRKIKNASPEKRRKRFRDHPPESYATRYERAVTQRMFLIDREKKTNSDEYGTFQEEVFDMAGTTGNVYQVTISKVPKCTCPDSRKGNQCKHVIYVLVNVLKAPAELQYQLAFLSTELEQIFANAPASPQSSDGSKEDTSHAGQRKPIEGDCSICMMEFEPNEDLVWCKAACGQNLHKKCFEQWAKTKPGEVKCVYCRTPWKGDQDEVKTIGKSGRVNGEGYVNVGAQLGLSGRRDTRTYHRGRGSRNWYDNFSYLDEDDRDYGEDY